jgi:DNA-binding LytR/AlgR family response regulator
MTIDCIIVDDEPIARKGLEGYIAKLSFLRLLDAFPDAVSAIEAIKANPQAVVLLDINMPHLSGTQLLRSLSVKPITIIISAYAEHALEGFELDVIDYIVKPVAFARFLKAVNKAKDYLVHTGSGKANTDHFFIKADNRIERIQMEDVMYIESLQNYVAVHTVQKKFISLISLKSLEEFLPRESFVKVQKSFIVNTKKVQSIEGDELIVFGKRIPISRVNREEIMQMLLGSRFIKRGM